MKNRNNKIRSDELGHKSIHQGEYQKCKNCGAKRFVRVDKRGKPESMYCKHCGGYARKNAKNEDMFRRGENREAKIEEVWGKDCYFCKEETKQLHRKDGESHDNIRRISVSDFKDLYNNEKGQYAKVCNNHHPKVHNVKDDGYTWWELEAICKEVYSDST